MDESILNSIKKFLGTAPGYEYFDSDIILCINTALSILTQIGVGPKTGFSIHDDTTTWGGYLGRDGRLEMVKQFIELRAKIYFDPGQNASLVNVLEAQAKELEWRIMIAAEQAPEDLKDLPPSGAVTGGLELPFSNYPMHRDTLTFGQITS